MKLQKLKPYIKALPAMFNYQFVTKLFLAVLLFVLRKLFQALLKSSGRVAVTSADFLFLFTTWQGILILGLGFVSLFLYIAVDINAQIVLSRQLVTGQKAPVGESLKEGFTSLGALLNLRGILVMLYIAFIAPVLGVGVSISMTEGFYIPSFISSFIESSVLYSALAGIAALIFLSVGIGNLFILHGIIVDKLPIREAGKQSSELMQANWKDFLKQNIMLILIIGGSIIALSLFWLYIPFNLIDILPLPKLVSRLLTVFFVIAGVLVSMVMDLFSVPLYIMKMTQLFYSYKQGSEYEIREGDRGVKGHWKWELIAVTIVAAVFSILITANFDELFPAERNVKIVAHRAGGFEGKENTVSGLQTACDLKVYGSEIDIQRTRDGHYVVNHDATFKRVAGVKRKPEEMTLKEIKKLSIDGEPVATLEEMLEASEGRLVLLIELKEGTADRKMADDVVQLLQKYQMMDECILISLKYKLIDYIETTYPEVQTGFLTFASFGRTADLNCDYLGLEEEAASTDTIMAIHHENKQVLVWTVNKKKSQIHFLNTAADGIITDNVKQAIRILNDLKKRNDRDRMVDRIKTIF